MIEHFDFSELVRAALDMSAHVRIIKFPLIQEDSMECLALLGIENKKKTSKI